MSVLGIETSCDETAAAVVGLDGNALSNAVYSQVADHSPFGGVVPDLAARKHVERLPAVIQQALSESGETWENLTSVAVTYGPGLAGALLVGMAAAKGIALTLSLPLVAVHHLDAHLYSLFLAPDAPPFQELCPFVATIVSGGHTCMVLVRAPGEYEMLGQTLDDAAGEAFDKGAKLLGMGYPGGPAIDRAGAGGDPGAVRFPRGFAGARDSLDFSFSGLKTALLYHLKKHPLDDAPERGADLAASFQEAIVDTLVERLEQAAERVRVGIVALAGGVSLNSRLRHKAAESASMRGWRLLTAPPRYCADNAAMVAAAAAAGLGIRGEAAFALDAAPSIGWAGH